MLEEGLTVTRPTMTVEEAAKFLGVSKSTAYAAAANGDIPAVRIRGRILIPVERLNAMLAGPESRAATAA